MKKILVFSFLVTFFPLIPHVFAVTFDDGASHIIDYSINDSVSIGGSGTSVEIREGAYIRWQTPEGFDYLTQGVLVGGTAEVLMSGGYIYGFLECNYDSVAVVSGGSTGELAMFGSRFDFQGGGTSMVMIGSSCQATLSGGTMNQLWTRENSRVSFSGGSLSHDLRTYEASLLTLIGNDFQINGVPVGYGDSARDYAVADILNGNPCLQGNLTGTLQSGQSLDIPFYIFDDSDIVFVPEPTTLLLLSLGGVLMRKRK